VAIKNSRKKTPLIMKADDTMPWGKHVGESIRSIYSADPEYFQYLLSSKEYEFYSPRIG